MLALPAVGQTVLVVECGALCDKLVAFLNRAAEDPKAAKAISDHGLIFGEPNCEPAGVTNPLRRCAWSHRFNETATGGDADTLWAAKRIVAKAADIGLVNITKPSDLAKYTEKRLDGTLPADWRYPTQP